MTTAPCAPPCPSKGQGHQHTVHLELALLVLCCRGGSIGAGSAPLLDAAPSHLLLPPTRRPAPLHAPPQPWPASTAPRWKAALSSSSSASTSTRAAGGASGARSCALVPPSTRSSGAQARHGSSRADGRGAAGHVNRAYQHAGCTLARCLRPPILSPARLRPRPAQQLASRRPPTPHAPRPPAAPALTAGSWRRSPSWAASSWSTPARPSARTPHDSSRSGAGGRARRAAAGCGGTQGRQSTFRSQDQARRLLTSRPTPPHPTPPHPTPPHPTPPHPRQLR
jgi:hypothetical protein